MSSMDSITRTSVPARRVAADLIATAHWDE
jgi:hypothetical protein